MGLSALGYIELDAASLPRRRRDGEVEPAVFAVPVGGGPGCATCWAGGERRPPGSFVCLRDRAPHVLVVSQRVQQAHALRAREDEAVARDRSELLHLVLPLAGLEVELADCDRPLANGRSEAFATCRIDAAKKRAETAVLHDAG